MYFYDPADEHIELVKDGKTVVMVTHDPSLTERTNRNIIISDGELIDETVAVCLPLLKHRQMLAVTKKAERLVYNPTQSIITCDEHNDRFFMIAKGNVDVVLQGKGGTETIASCLLPGQYFGEIELLKGGKSIANVRASEKNGVEVLAIYRNDFLTLLRESPLTEEAIGRIVQQRISENQSIDSRNKIAGLFG